MTASTRAAAKPRRKRLSARKSRAPLKRKGSKQAVRSRKTPTSAKSRESVASAKPRRISAAAKKEQLRHFTAEFLAEAQRRVEQTTESTTAIAGKLGMHQSVLWRLIRRKRWVRPEASLRRRGLSPAMRLAAAVDAAMTERVRQSPRFDTVVNWGDESSHPIAAAALPDPSAIDRFEQGVLHELATVEAMRASLGSEPARPIDAERTARTLSILAETLAKLRRMRLAPASPSGSDYDDIPADIDEFRRDFAWRIDTFVASRTEQRSADGDSAAAPVDEAR